MICGDRVMPGLACNQLGGHWDNHKRTWRSHRLVVELDWPKRVNGRRPFGTYVGMAVFLIVFGVIAAALITVLVSLGIALASAP